MRPVVVSSRTEEPKNVFPSLPSLARYNVRCTPRRPSSRHGNPPIPGDHSAQASCSLVPPFRSVKQPSLNTLLRSVSGAQERVYPVCRAVERTTCRQPDEQRRSKLPASRRKPPENRPALPFCLPVGYVRLVGRHYHGHSRLRLSIVSARHGADLRPHSLGAPYPFVVGLRQIRAGKSSSSGELTRSRRQEPWPNRTPSKRSWSGK